MAKEKEQKALKKSGVKGRRAYAYKKTPSDELYNQLRDVFDNFSKKREKAFKSSERWEYLKQELLEAAGCGIKHVLVKTTEKEHGEGKNYTEWEIDIFVGEYGLLYCLDENRWRIYWF